MFCAPCSVGFFNGLLAGAPAAIGSGSGNREGPPLRQGVGGQRQVLPEAPHHGLVADPRNVARTAHGPGLSHAPGAPASGGLATRARFR